MTENKQAANLRTALADLRSGRGDPLALIEQVADVLDGSAEPTQEPVAWQVIAADGSAYRTVAYDDPSVAKGECEEWARKWNAAPWSAPSSGNEPYTVRPLYAAPVPAAEPTTRPGLDVEDIAFLASDPTDERGRVLLICLRNCELYGYGCDCYEEVKALFEAHPLGAAERVSDDTARLNYVLRDAMLAPTEGGDTLGLFLTTREEEKAFAVVARATSETDEEEPFTAENVPFLSADQRAHINGSIPDAAGCITDPVAIRAALDRARSALPDAPGETHA